MFFPSLSVLWVGIRPKTLSMSLTPVFAATCLVIGQEKTLPISILIAICLSAISIQIATNLFNDAQDFITGTDTKDRIGPKRITQSGMASPTQTRIAGAFFIFIAALCGVYLFWQGGWVIALFGITALLSAYGYSHGPLPLSRSPLGEVFVLFFFGWGAYNLTYFLLVGHLPENGEIIGCAIGLPACAILLLNNYRDLENDTIAGRRTLAILLGNAFSKILFSVFILSPYMLLFSSTGHYSYLLGLPLALIATLKIFKITDKKQLNPVLGISAASQILMCLGLGLDFLFTP